jgi:hypothetical protein
MLSIVGNEHQAPATESPNRTPALLRECPMAQSFFLREQADRCRRLARGTNDPVTQERLVKLAAEYEAQADAQDDVDEEAPAVPYGKRDDDND